ncbi:MAG: hypothetical protein IJR68_04550 [Fretibacterium sp.]|nr:hypothetical protein [Fretibacterium sp.]
MADEFVRQDVFDANMRRMEALMDRNLTKHESIAERLERKFDMLNTRLDGKFDTMNARIDALQNKFAWNIAWVGIVIAIVLAITQHLWR